MFRMSRADRARWANAASLADLGELTALWLEGKIASQPGYEAGCGPEPETKPLIPVLAAANRAGYFTNGSQPGHAPERGHDGATYAQRAAVDGHVADRSLLDCLTAAARRAGLIVDLDREVIVVTTRDGRPVTGFGGRVPRGYMRRCYSGVIGAGAYRELKQAAHLTIVDPEWGPSTRLWDVLDRAVKGVRR
ncbi:DUF6919 domain-containing protein [Streptomyces sp. 4N509B]|uniref:DUF6919 domain-containing protein n=1 Tax=Streptomyces sp. 4N509B TaxID=3457413 RepID=UPI003FD567C2